MTLDPTRALKFPNITKHLFDGIAEKVVGELNRYNVVVGGLQETKWFGCWVYNGESVVVLTAGRDVPGGSEVRQRGEGVAIVLSGRHQKCRRI